MHFAKQPAFIAAAVIKSYKKKVTGARGLDLLRRSRRSIRIASGDRDWTDERTSRT